MAGKRGQTRVQIYPDWCKGCGICVTFCPAGVFALGPQGKATVVREAMCVDCGFCELHCPDFAVSVTRRTAEKSEAQPVAVAEEECRAQ